MIKMTTYAVRVLAAGLLGELAILGMRVRSSSILPVQVAMWSHYVLPVEERENDAFGQLAIKRYYLMKANAAVT